MTLRSLEIFVSVVDNGKMSSAANELYITQPTISKTIAELEQEYEMQLFNRLGKKLYLTEAGKRLYGYANQILSLVDEMGKEIKDLAENKTLLLGATITVGQCVLVDIVKRFEAEMPNIKINVTIDNTAVIEYLLLSSKADIGLIEGRVKSSELVSIPVITDRLVLACSPMHELAGRDFVGLEELVKYPFIMREEGSGTRELFEEILHKNGLYVHVKWKCHGSDSILEALLANQGLTVISERLITPYEKIGRLCIVPIRGVDMSRHFSLVHHKTKYIGDALSKFISFVHQYG